VQLRASYLVNKLILIFLIFISCSSSFFNPFTKQGNGISKIIETNHFEIRYSAKFQREAKVISKYCDQSLEKLLQYYGFDSTSVNDFYSYFYKKRGKFPVVIGYGSDKGLTAGFYDEDYHTIVLNKLGGYEVNTVSTLIHELSHAIFNYRPLSNRTETRGISRAVDEGVASALGHITLDNENIKIGINDSLHITYTRLYVRNSVKKVGISLNRAGREHLKWNYLHSAYSVSESFILYLVEQFGEDSFQSFLKALVVKGGSLSTAAKSVFGFYIRDLETQWRLWVVN